MISCMRYWFGHLLSDELLHEIWDDILGLLYEILYEILNGVYDEMLGLLYALLYEIVGEIFGPRV